MASDDVADRIVPDLEVRMEEAVRAYRDHHRHPANIALHVVGYALAARSALQLFRGRFVVGVVGAVAAAGILVAGHRIEGNEPLSAMRSLQGENR